MSTDGTITFGTPAVYGGVYSLSPAITRLSDNSFAVCYFDNTDAGAPVAITRYGKSHYLRDSYARIAYLHIVKGKYFTALDIYNFSLHVYISASVPLNSIHRCRGQCHSCCVPFS